MQPAKNAKTGQLCICDSTALNLTVKNSWSCPCQEDTVSIRKWCREGWCQAEPFRALPRNGKTPSFMPPVLSPSTPTRPRRNKGNDCDLFNTALQRTGTWCVEIMCQHHGSTANGKSISSFEGGPINSPNSVWAGMKEDRRVAQLRGSQSLPRGKYRFLFFCFSFSSKASWRINDVLFRCICLFSLKQEK